MRHDDSSVTTPKGFKEAYKAYAEGGWMGLSVDPAYGGQGLPYCIGVSLNEFAISANQSFAMYPGLTLGAIAALYTHASDAQKQTYLPKMTSGQWTGTMNSEMPLVPSGAPSIRARTRWTILSVMSCSPAEMKIFWPEIL